MSLAFFRKAMEFIEFAGSGASVDAIGTRFGETIREMGFSWFSCFGMRRDFSAPEDSSYHMDFPEAWLAYYWEQEYQFKDRIIEVAIRSTLPFRWSSDLVQHKMNKTQKLIFAEAEDIDLVEAVCVPVHAHGFVPGLVVVVSESHDISREAEHAVQMMAVHLHDVSMRYHLSARGEEPAPVYLTPREIECLKWVADGKSDWEISEILKCAESTVHNHIENAKRKLNVRTRSQAVSQAWLQNILYQ